MCLSIEVAVSLIWHLHNMHVCMIFFIIALSASQYNGSSQVEAEDLQFPKSDDLVNYTSQFQPLVAKLPPAVIEERFNSTSGKQFT